MSRQKKEQPVKDGPSEEAVAEYLRSYPDFFARHSSLFADLRLVHKTGGPATSLLERQIALLRQRNRETEEQLKDLVSVAKLNNSLVEKIHQFYVLSHLIRDQQQHIESLHCLLKIPHYN